MRYNTDALVEELHGALSGHTLDQGQVTWLTAPLDDSGTTLVVENPGQLGRGIAEVGDELVYVSEVGPSTVTLAPFGRGFQATTAREWPIGTRVSMGPRFPRARILEAINDVIRGTWPMLFAVGEHEIEEPGAAQVTYELPADAVDVFTVKQLAGPGSGFEHTYTQYGVNKNTSPITVDILEGVGTNAPIKVSYQKAPVAIESGGSFEDSGLRERAWPVIKFGAMFQLIGPQEAGRSGADAVEAAEANRSRPASPAALARQYYAVYQQLLAEERDRLLAETEIFNNEEYF